MHRTSNLICATAKHASLCEPLKQWHNKRFPISARPTIQKTSNSLWGTLHSGIASEVTSVASPKSFTYTEEELAAVPAAVFTRFRSLPREIQDRVWHFDVPEVIIEANYDPWSRQYHASVIRSPNSQSLKTSSSKTKLFPVYIEHVDRAEWDGPEISRIWIRSSNIIYLNALDSIDMDTFLAREDSQNIENLAITAPYATLLARGEEPEHAHGGESNYTRRLIRGLRKLKNLYVTEGQWLGLEERLAEERHDADHVAQMTYRLSWSEVSSGELETSLPSNELYNQSPDHMGRPSFGWHAGRVEDIKR